MKLKNSQQKTSADVRRLRKQLLTLKLFLWEVLSSPRVISQEELDKLRDKAGPLIMEEPAPEKLEELCKKSSQDSGSETTPTTSL